MSRLTAFVALVMACALAPAAEWKEFTSQPGGFSVTFPKEPKHLTRNATTALGKLTTHLFVVEIENGRVTYLVAYADYPVELAASDAQKARVLDGVRHGAIKAVKGGLTMQRDLELAGNPGREFAFTHESRQGKGTVHNRVYLVGRRLYQLKVVHVGDAPLDPKDVDKFFASFKLAAK